MFVDFLFKISKKTKPCVSHFETDIYTSEFGLFNFQNFL